MLLYIYTHFCYVYIYIHTITYIYLHHTHSLPFFCVISHVYIVVHFYYAFFCVFDRYIMAPWPHGISGVDQFPGRRAGHLGSGGLWLQPSGGSLRTHLDGFHGDFLGVKGSLQTKKITLVNHVFFRDVDLWVSVQKKNIHDITIE